MIDAHTWDSEKDANRCIVCGRKFVSSDLVVNDVAVTAHVTCIGEDVKQHDSFDLTITAHASCVKGAKRRIVETR